jgi:signal transduction histidine kinase
VAKGQGVSAGEPGHWQGLLGSMRVRIVVTLTLLLALSAAVSIALLRSALRDRLDEEITVGLQREAEEFALIANGTNPQTGEPFGTDFAAMFDLYFRREVPDEGETLLAFVDGELYHSEDADSAVPADQLGGARDYWLSLREREEGRLQTEAGVARYVAVPLRTDGHEALFVAANFPSVERNEIDDAVRTQAVVQFGMIIVATLLGIALAGRVLRPLSHLADTAQTISATDLTRRIPVRGEDEASRIATAFNEMLERIERSFATQRQFLDDASHELRSPMTVIRGHIELLELEDDPAEREAMIRVITDEIDRMNRIVEDLLLLARSERPGFLTMEPVPIAELIDDVHRRASVLCSRNWLVGSHPTATLIADRQLLTQALLQLAQNVCQHTPEGTTARIGASLESGGRVALWIEDDGPGVPPDRASRVFERFVKGSELSEGSGLGLSIVAAIAEAHGGEARLAAGRQVGARFEVSVPIRAVSVHEAPTPVG